MLVQLSLTDHDIYPSWPTITNHIIHLSLLDCMSNFGGSIRQAATSKLSNLVWQSFSPGLSAVSLPGSGCDGGSNFSERKAKVVRGGRPVRLTASKAQQPADTSGELHWSLTVQHYGPKLGVKFKPPHGTTRTVFRLRLALTLRRLQNRLASEFARWLVLRLPGHHRLNFWRHRELDFRRSLSTVKPWPSEFKRNFRSQPIKIK